MLVLTRKKDEKIIIEGGIEIQIMDIGEGKVKIGINAPSDIAIHRSEIYDMILEENQAATQSAQSLKNFAELYEKKK